MNTIKAIMRQLAWRVKRGALETDEEYDTRLHKRALALYHFYLEKDQLDRLQLNRLSEGHSSSEHGLKPGLEPDRHTIPVSVELAMPKQNTVNQNEKRYRLDYWK